MMFLLNFLILLGGLQNEPLHQVDPSVPESRTLPIASPTFWGKIMVEPETSDFDNDADTVSYAATKIRIGLLRTRLHYDLNKNRIDLDSVKQVFGDRLINHVIPYWYGTGWSFGGHTSVPKEGKIACGYFVSTTLNDMGLKLDRYKLAQKSPIDEAKALSCGTEITTIAHEDPEQALAQINAHIKKGVYFIGFDTGHVGFLVKKKGKLFLVHSNYLSPVSVCIEPLETAKVFKTFTKFHLVDISNNEKLIEKWLNNDVVLR